ncbi:7034_t:CDS:2 [Funneliformis geosporum]|nr:7034_t:CDS:2 [Funneliformis geosporum]
MKAIIESVVHQIINSTKAIYAELFGLSKKVDDKVLKANMQHKLSNILKSFIYDIQNNMETELSTIVNNPTVTRHKE